MEASIAVGGPCPVEHRNNTFHHRFPEKVCAAGIAAVKKMITKRSCCY